MTPKSIDVAREELEVSKREVETGVVHVRKIVHEREHLVDEPLVRTEVQIDRVPVDRIVAEIPEPRQEGDTLVLPVMEEVLVKQWLLKEELRIRRSTVQTPQQQRVVLKQEEVVVERTKERN